MDESLKARLIGATVLVLLAVVLVPEMLSGPKRASEHQPAGKATRTHVIDLGGAVSAGARLESPDSDPGQAASPQALPAPARQGGPAATQAADAASTDAPPGSPGQPAAESPAASPAERPPAQPAAPVADRAAQDVTAERTPPPAAPPASANAPAKGSYAVQVGAFGAEATARKLVAELKGAGLPAYIAPLTKSGKTLHRVRVGPVADKAGAEELAVKLKGRGLPVSVVSGG
jgi:DedD protein